MRRSHKKIMNSFISFITFNIQRPNLFYFFFHFSAARPVGDTCVDDFDGDGVKDNDDHCPYVKHLSKTSFTDHFTVDLYPGHSDQLPVWRVAKSVCLARSLHSVCSYEVHQGFGSLSPPYNFLRIP